ncbi:MAG: hypothetical protein ACOCT9_00295 [archaeon]
MSKSAYYQNIMDAFNNYVSSDDEYEPDFEDNKAMELISKDLSNFSGGDAEEGQKFAARLAQAIIAAVSEGVASTDTE